ncbi:MAG TPA: hypothetical protein GX693_02520 [Firmicutes bacterium]|nr:hypothetical protein [Bacillota bacterium]
MLGHYVASFTLDTYGHVFHDSKKEAVRRFEKFRAERLDNLKTAHQDDIVI